MLLEVLRRIVAGMTDELPLEPPDVTRTFLAERYRAGTSRMAARRETEAARIAAAQLSLEGRHVTLMGSLLVPSDDTIFSLFGAESSEDVAAVGDRADQPYDRISEGVPLTSGVTGAPTSRGP